MSSSNGQANGGSTNGGNNSTASGTTHTSHEQHSATGHDLHGQPGVPLMHRTVDELLSADFPLGMSNVRRPDGNMNNGVQGNIIENLDDLFREDFSAVGGGSGPNHASLGLHMAMQTQTTQIHFTATQSPQGGLSPMQQHQQLLQHQQAALGHAQLAHSPHVSPALSHAALSAQHLQQARAQQVPSVLSHQYPQHLQAANVASRPIYQQEQQQQTPPRPAQPNIVQVPTLTQASVMPNGQPGIPAAARPPTTTAAPVAQAGSPLHRILSSCSPAKRHQLTLLFARLQSKEISANDFMAAAEQLLDPTQIEILDSIRRAQPQPPTPAVVTPGMARPGHTGPIHTPPAGVGLPTMATPTLAGPVPVNAASIPATSLPPTSAGMSQSAPVRKRNTDGTSPTPATPDSKVASKRLKTEHQVLTPGANVPNPQIAVPTVQTPLPATPGGIPTPGVYSRVSLPGQQRPLPTAVGAGVVTPGTPAAGVAAGGIGAAAKASATGAERVNFEDLTDVMGYVGVDLKEESDNIMRDNDGYSRSNTASDGQDRTRIQNFVNLGILKSRVERVAAKHRIQAIEPDVLAYLAMAAQERLRGLAEQMIQASKHRGRSLATAPPPMYDEEHPMYKVVINQDVKRQLLAIERVEREEETKRKEQIADRERRLAAGEELDENGELRGGPSNPGSKKTKKQKEGGPGVSARNMTEEARKKVANQTALGFAGGGRTYSWMMGGGGQAGAEGGPGGGASPLPSALMSGAPSAAAAAAAAAPSTGSPSASGSGASSTPKPSLGRNATMPALVSGTSSTMSGVGIGSQGVTSSLSSSSLTRGVGSSGSMVLPPSTVGRSVGLRDTTRKVNVKDALFCLERDQGGGGGEGSGQRVLIKSYVKWLK
ncbi:transcription initiation factor TFIID component TAF4 family-domain-containing protein [Mortierella sp. GBAus27b]|nr:hypothetical protein BGX31_002293 [Mortierella sp. GBA43]KAI8346062.1 transcription initiation factor TFIID component TAF4 family-domain-containing protein [Mortierella sp. GBAus27b]